MQGVNPLLVILVMGAVTGLFYALFYRSLSGDAAADKRLEAVAERRRAVRGDGRVVDANARRKQIADSLKEIEERQRSRSASLEDKLGQAGLTLTKQQFFLVCGGAGLAGAAAIAVIVGKIWLAPAGLIVCGVGLPLWMLGFLRTRRMEKFTLELPNAMDVIVRGIRAGLPLGDCLRIIASEAQEPVRSEFRTVVEQQTMGVTLPDAVDRMAQRVPVTEANFFAIVINIQTKSGGNLSEALGNLSRVLRERKKMRGKISAMSMEAKASAAIIGALPFIVATLIYFTAPAYMSLLFTTQAGQFTIAGSLGVMFVGVMVMRNMIRFDI